jgi:hypothetical protein
VTHAGTYLLKITVEISYSDYNIYTFESESSEFNVTSTIKNIILNITNSVDQYETNVFNLTVVGDDGEDFLDGYSVELTLDDGSTLGGWSNLSGIETTEQDLSFYFKENGNFNLIVNVTESDESSYISETYSVTVNPAYIEIETISVKFK